MQKDYNKHTYYYQRQSAPGYQVRPKKRSGRKFSKSLGLLLVVAVAILATHLFIVRQASAHDRQIEIQQEQAKTQRINKLGPAMNGLIQNNPQDNFQVVVEDLSNNQLSSFGTQHVQAAASVEKVVTAAYFLHQVEQGRESLTETLGDGNTAQYDLDQMVVVSDDNAWLTLNHELTYTDLQNYVSSIGLKNYDSVANTMTPQDIAVLLGKLYQGKLLNPFNTNLLLSYLKQANYRDFIVPAVPSNDTIYHKVGELDDIVNDSSIITDGSHSLVLVIFSDGQGTYDWPARASVMQQMTKEVIFTYLNY